MYKFYAIKTIKNYRLGKYLLDKYNEKINFVNSEKDFFKIIKDKNLTYTQEKENIFFGVKKGKFVKKYNISSELMPVKEKYYLNYENNCPANCLYCYLREYYKCGAIIFYVNFEDMFLELDNFKQKDQMISSGITNDSFALEKITNASKNLFEYFIKREDLTLEFRTKFNNVDFLTNLVSEKKHHKNIIPSFTLNPNVVIKKYENKTSLLKGRLEAIKKMQNHGFDIGLRIDPIINVDNSINLYRELISEIFSVIDRSKIRDVGLGVLRYKKGLEKEVLKEFSTDLFFKNFVTGIDGKKRYFKSIRVKLYKEIINEIKKYGKFDIYLGMEPDYIYDLVMGDMYTTSY